MRAIASIRRQEPAAAGERSARGSDADSIWLKYGLAVPRFRRSPQLDARLASLPRGARFRLALEEAGGTLALFGRFLAGRADLLPGSHCSELLEIFYPRLHLTPGKSLKADLRDPVRDLAFLHASAGSESYRGTWRGRSAVIEIFQEAPRLLQEGSWKRFCAALRPLADEIEQPITRPSVHEEFRQWHLVQCDIARKRTILRNLQTLPSGCVSRIPRPIPELESETVLAYEGVDGRVLAADLKRYDTLIRDDLRLATESFLEQSLLLSFVAADSDPRNLVMTDDGGVAFRVLPALVPVPAEFNFELTQYTASFATGDAPRAIRMLARIVRGQCEPRLWKEFSALQPLLKIRADAPESVTAMENYWRALAGVGLRVPLFLQLFHRQAGIWGRYNGQVAPAADLIYESLWPLFGRILRFHLAEVASAEKAREWLIGGGLLLFASTRQVGLTLQQLRDNDLSLTVETGEDPAREQRSGRFTAAVVAFSMLLVLLVFSLQVAFRGAAPMLQLSGSLVALLCGVLLFLLVVRME
ncbi:MAG: hypothetical protein HY315_09665 [Acidobacteria bacterium]|nr:hypothetical protein [Acidobacteriota bacterium]